MTTRKTLIILLTSIAIVAGLGSCWAGYEALGAALKREARSLRWMHERGYLAPPELGTDTALDQIPDWDAVVYELQETNMSASLGTLGAFLATFVCVTAIVLLAVISWPRGVVATPEDVADG